MTSIRELLEQIPPLSYEQKVYLSANFLWNVARYQVEMALHIHSLHLTSYSTSEEVEQYKEAEALFQQEFHYVERGTRLREAEIDLFAWGKKRLYQEEYYTSSHEYLLAHVDLHPTQKKRVIDFLMQLRSLRDEQETEPLKVLPLAQLASLDEQEQKRKGA